MALWFFAGMCTQAVITALLAKLGLITPSPLQQIVTAALIFLVIVALSYYY